MVSQRILIINFFVTNYFNHGMQDYNLYLLLGYESFKNNLPKNIYCD